MNCDKCGDAIEAGEERELHGQNLCDDCYMDRLSPARACDPWAVHSAKSFMNQPFNDPGVNPIQAKILDILKESGGVEAKILVERLQIKPSDLERELASLRHMEKVRGELRDGKKIVRLW
jgi:hypothetical protein